MLPEYVTSEIRRVTGRVAERTLAHTQLTPTKVTVAGLVLMLGAVWLLAIGSFVWAGCLIGIASSFDMLDGALARVTNTTSRFGAFLDSTLDRYSESLVFFGLLLFYQHHTPASTTIVLIYAAALGSLLVSYVRARAEALGFTCKVGLLERPERVVLIVFGLVTGWIYITIWLLAILTHVTAAQRIYHVWRQGGRSSETPKRSLPLTGDYGSTKSSIE